MTDELFNIPDSCDELAKARKRLEDARMSWRASCMENGSPEAFAVAEAMDDLERIERERINL